jgi:hypothetical protein
MARIVTTPQPFLVQLAAPHQGPGNMSIEQVERHRSVQYAAHDRDVIVGVAVPVLREHLVVPVGVDEDVVRRLPVGVLVGIAEARYPERRPVSERSAKVGRSGACSDRRLERVNDPLRIVRNASSIELSRSLSIVPQRATFSYMGGRSEVPPGPIDKWARSHT